MAMENGYTVRRDSWRRFKFLVWKENTRKPPKIWSVSSGWRRGVDIRVMLVRQKTLSVTIRCGTWDKPDYETQIRDKMQQKTRATRNTKQVVGNEKMGGGFGPRDYRKVGNSKTTVGNQATRQTTTGAKRQYRNIGSTSQESDLPIF